MITLEKARLAIEAAEKKAKELKVAICTVVVDDHGSLIAAGRMDGALVISPRFAYAKAHTAAVLRMPTNAIGAYAADNKPYFGVNTLFAGELTPIAGGVPIMIQGQVVGGVGCGGSADVSQDDLCAAEASKILSG